MNKILRNISICGNIDIVMNDFAGFLKGNSGISLIA